MLLHWLLLAFKLVWDFYVREFWCWDKYSESDLIDCKEIASHSKTNITQKIAREL